MRNAFVVLVSLCIGLASGFIVPSGAVELIDDNHGVLVDKNDTECDEAKRAIRQDETGFIVLPFRTNNGQKMDLESNQNGIEDKELFEQDSTKQSNVNERSFIYINQKYKTPIVNQLYSSHNMIREPFKPKTYKEGEINHYQYPEKHNPDSSVAKLKEEYVEANIGRTETKSLYFPPASQYNQGQGMAKTSSNIKNNHDFGPKTKLNRVTNDQREYVELLKKPLLRPMDKKKDSRLWTNPEQLLSKPLNKNLHGLNVPVDPRQFSMNSYENYGFASPYGYQRSLSSLNYIGKPDELGLVTDSSLIKLVNDNNNVDVNKLLDRYLKDSLEDQVTNERINGKNTICNYSNCVSKPTKQFLNRRMKADKNCKCGRRLNVLKQRESSGFEDKEPITEKELHVGSEVNVINVSPKSSETNDYSDMLTEEMNLKQVLIED